MRNVNILDIETGPRDAAIVHSFFDPEKVAVGNLKDPQKIADKIAEAEANAFERAALSAITGEVVCIGIMKPEGDRIFLDAKNLGERECVERFWELNRSAYSAGSAPEWVGWNLVGFDMPFIIQRSFFLGIPVPAGIMQGRYFTPRFIDLMVNFTCGVYGAFQGLDTVARFLQVGGKDPENPCEGKIAHEFFRSTDPTKRLKGFEYLHNDLIITRRVAERMLGLPRLYPEAIGEIPVYDPTTPGPHPRTFGPYPIEALPSVPARPQFDDDDVPTTDAE